MISDRRGVSKGCRCVEGMNRPVIDTVEVQSELSQTYIYDGTFRGIFDWVMNTPLHCTFPLHMKFFIERIIGIFT